MEQKTEASQAVDDTVERGKFVTEYLRYMAKEAPQSHPEMVYSMAHTRWDGIAGVMWRAGRAALKAQPANIDPALLRALLEARDLAMKNTVAARAPECGDFGAIAQNLDYVISQLKAQPAPTEAARDRIPMPTNADQAELMQKLGLAWLQTNAPDRLTDASLAAQGEDSALLIAMLVDRDTPTDNRRDVIDHDIRGNPITREMVARASAETGGVKP